jgi:hypothetical protein
MGERCGTGQRNHERAKADLEHWKRNTPVPLPEKRPRRLSLPTGEEPRKRAGFGWFAQRDKPSTSTSQSRLLQLPAEVRDAIWAFAMGDRRIHITSGEVATRQPRLLPPLMGGRAKAESRIHCHGFVDCGTLDFQEWSPNPQMDTSFVVNGQRWASPDAWHCRTCGHFFDLGGFGEWQRTLTVYNSGLGRAHDAQYMSRNRSTDGWNPLAVLQTCRTIYRESLPHLYGDNTFLLLNEKQAVDWPTTLLPSTRALVKSIHLRARPTVEQFYHNPDYNLPVVLDGLAKFKKLRHLWIDFSFEPQLYGLSTSERLDDGFFKLGETTLVNGGEVVLRIPHSRDEKLRQGAKGIRVVVETY